MKRHLIVSLALTCLGVGISLAQVPQEAQHISLRPIHPVSYVRPIVTHSAGFLTANKTPSNKLTKTRRICDSFVFPFFAPI